MAATRQKQRPKMNLTGPADPPKPLGGTDIPPPPAPAAKAQNEDKNRQASRVGKRAITFYVGQDAFRQLRVLSAQTDKPIQVIMTEALDWVFQEHGLHRIAKE